MNPKTLFLQGLIIGTAANLVAEAFRSEAKDAGLSNSHILAFGLGVFALGLLVLLHEEG